MSLGGKQWQLVAKCLFFRGMVPGHGPKRVPVGLSSSCSLWGDQFINSFPYFAFLTSSLLLPEISSQINYLHPIPCLRRCIGEIKPKKPTNSVSKKYDLDMKQMFLYYLTTVPKMYP